MCVRETGWGVTVLFDSACFARTCECSVQGEGEGVSAFMNLISDLILKFYK